MNKLTIKIIAAVGIITLLIFAAFSIKEVLKGKNVAYRKQLKEAKIFLEKGQRAEAIKILEAVASSQRDAKSEYEALAMLAGIYEKDKNLVKVKEIYTIIANKYSKYCDYPGLQKKLSSLNELMIFSPVSTIGSDFYTVTGGDSLEKIAKKFSTTVEFLKRTNGLSTHIIRPGMKLKVPVKPFTIVVDKSQSALTLLYGNDVVKIYTVSTGKNNCTPTGIFKIRNKLVDPLWYSPKGAVIAAGDPENALGTRWMGFGISQPDYGIHGTNDTKSIGYQCTEGCIRMRNEDVEELFAIVPVGTEATVID